MTKRRDTKPDNLPHEHTEQVLDAAHFLRAKGWNREAALIERLARLVRDLMATNTRLRASKTGIRMAAKSAQKALTRRARARRRADT